MGNPIVGRTPLAAFDIEDWCLPGGWMSRDGGRRHGKPTWHFPPFWVGTRRTSKIVQWTF